MDDSTKDKQEALDRRYIRMASIWAENSYCQRRQVGALIVKDKMIISDGYNGTPSGFENVCEDENNVTKPYVLHAEANAITKIARSNNSSNGATMFGRDEIAVDRFDAGIGFAVRVVHRDEQGRRRAGTISDAHFVCEPGPC